MGPGDLACFELRRGDTATRDLEVDRDATAAGGAYASYLRALLANDLEPKDGLVTDDEELVTGLVRAIRVARTSGSYHQPSTSATGGDDRLSVIWPLCSISSKGQGPR